MIGVAGMVHAGRLPITNPPKLPLTPFPANFRVAVRWPSEWPNFGVVSAIAIY